MKKKQSLYLFVASVILVSSITTIPVITFAEDDTSEAITDATVLFEEDDDGTTDPENPGGGGEGPDGPGGGNSSGSLRIDYVSDMDFGNQKISGSDKQYNPFLVAWKNSGETAYIPQFIQITDNRGSNSGWELQVKRSQFKTEDNESLVGETLAINKTELVKLGDVDTGAKPDYVAAKFDIPVDSPVSVIKANENQGMSTWACSFGDAVPIEQAVTNPKDKNDDINLFIPGSSPKKSEKRYHSDITWILVAGEA